MPPCRTKSRSQAKDLRKSRDAANTNTDTDTDIEALAQQKAKYFIVPRKRTMRSRRTSTARDRAVAALCAQPGVRDGPFCAGTLVGPDDEPHAFLEAVEEVLADP